MVTYYEIFEKEEFLWYKTKRDISDMDLIEWKLAGIWDNIFIT
jgi:hypothetical protein